MQLIGRFDPSQPHYFSTFRPRQGLFFSLQIYKYYRKNTNIPPLFYFPPLFCRFYSVKAAGVLFKASTLVWVFSMPVPIVESHDVGLKQS